MLSKLTTLLFLMIGLTGCIGESPSDISVGQGSLTHPDFNGIGVSVKNPALNASVLEKVVISGRCSHKNYPIKLTISSTSKTVYSICQQDFTWAAGVDVADLVQGSFDISVQIFDELYSESSQVLTHSLTKAEQVCSQETDSEVFANFKTGGDGTNTPYIICNSEQFLNIRFYPDKKFVLGRNIDFANRVIRPMPLAFKGELDGLGMQISNFVIKDLTGNGVSVGLFKYAHNAVIRNISIKNANVEGYQRVGILAGDWRGNGTLENIKVQGKAAGVSFVGGLIGLANTSSNLNITNLEAELTVSGNNYVGGVISYIVSNDGSFNLNNSYVLSEVSGIDYVGGVIGRSLEDNINIDELERIGKVSSFGRWVGGIAGEVPGGLYKNIKNVGIISSVKDAEDVFVGGLIGEGKGNITVADSESTSSITTGGHYTGGLFGKVRQLNVTNSLSRGLIKVQDQKYDSVSKFVGGIAGGISLNSSIVDTRSFMDLDVKAQYVGGLVGIMNGESGTISNSYAIGSIKAHTSHIGGLVGIFGGNSIESSFSQMGINIINPTPNSYIGGLVGQSTNQSAVFSRLYSKSDILIENGTSDMVGGLFGSLEGVSLNEAYFTGSISGVRSKVGAIAGITKADINKSYSVATIDASFRYVGSIAGIVQDASVNDVFAMSDVHGKGEVGGLVGWHNSSADISRAYFIGSINKRLPTNFPDNSFGQLVGIKSSGSIVNSFFASSNSMKDSDLNIFNGNSVGGSLSPSQLRNTLYYSNFVFGEGLWSAPESGFKLPFVANDYLYASFDWMREPNLGFSLPQVFEYDPLAIVYPSIFIQGVDALEELDQAHLEIVNSNTPVTKVNVGELQISVEAPETNSEVVSGKKLVYGECGIPGNRIIISGDFSIVSICQGNHRWAAVLDTAPLPIGNINFSVVMKSLDNTQSSNVVNKTMIKTNDLCDQEEATSGTFANSYLGADGAGTPFKICHAGHFANIAFYPNSNFELMADIDFGGNTIQPIQSIFTGKLDGKSHKVKNFVIEKTSAVGVGLFKIIKDAQVVNLELQGRVKGYERNGLLTGSWVGSGILRNIKATGEVEGILYTGGLIGLANSDVDLDIDQLDTEMTVKGNGFTGGVLGHISTLDGAFVAKNLVLNNDVQGLNNVGGFIGSSLESNIILENIQQSGNVLGLKENVGGIAGHLRSGVLTNLSVSGDVTSKYFAKVANVGGIIGISELTSFNLNTATYTGNIKAGGDNVGAIVGKLVQGQITNAQSHGTINILDEKYNSVRSYIGGIVGHVIEDSTITDSFSTISIDAKAQFVGGLAGRFHGKNSVFTGSHFIGEVSASTSFIGGVAGFFFGETFHDNYSKANITVLNPTPNTYVGGIVGYANSWTSDYKRIYSTGNITISNGTADYVGGLVGYFRGGSLKECYATGDITGARSAVGALVGLHRGLTQHCYATGNIDANFRHVGGLVGYLLNGEIVDSFSLGQVKAGAQAGGIVGFANSDINSIRNVYAYGNISRQESSDKPLNEFGQIVGIEKQVGTVVEVSSLYDGAKSSAGHNSIGSSISIGDADVGSTYPSFDFSSPGSWRMPSSNFVLAGNPGEYTYPIHEWLGSGQTIETYLIGGTLVGLNYGHMELTLNNQETIVLSAGEPSFSFSSRLASGTPYAVTLTQGVGYESVECLLNNSVGHVGTTDITNIEVLCPSLNSISLNPSNPMAGVGSNVSMNAKGNLSNGVEIDLTSEVTWSSLDTNIASVSASGVVSALSIGQTDIKASILTLEAQTSFTAFSSISEATGLSWQESSPHNTLSVNATWSPSVSSNVAGQNILIYPNNICADQPIKNELLGAQSSSYNFLGEHTKVYSYKVKTISTDNVIKDSSCSSAMTILLDPPDGVSNLASSAVWVSGALPIDSPVLSWNNPSGVEISNIKVSLGSNFGAEDIVSAVSVGLNNTHVFQNLSNLSECSPYFPGVVVIDENGLESNKVVDTVGFRWDNSAPETIESVSTSGSASETATGEFSWVAPTDNCAVRFYELAIGTTPGGIEISNGFKAIGNVTSYTAVSGLHGFNFNLSNGVDYYTSVRSVDYAGNRSIHQVSSSWQVSDLQQSLPELILWLDSTDKLSILDNSGNNADSPLFNSRVKEWIDISNSTYSHDFRAVTSDAEPYYTNDTVFFNGSNHFFTTDNHTEINTSTVSEKNISFAFRTENNIDTTQVLYEEGGTVRGMNIYINEGRLYCGFWNVTNDGDGAQPFLSASTPISRNKTYTVSWVFDYSNYTGPTGADGSLKCYLNNTLIGEESTTTRVFPHSGAIGIGGMYNDTYYHTGAASGDGDRFRGEILEVMITNQSVDETVVETIHNYLLGKWAQDDLSRPNNLAINNNATSTKSPSATWEAIDPNLFNTAYYEIAIGTTPGGTEQLYWMNIGDVNSYQVVDGVDGASLILQPGPDYYYSVRAIDTLGNISQIAISDPWKLFDFSTELTDVVLNLAASDLESVVDELGHTANDGGFSGNLQEWLDTSISNVVHNTHSVGAFMPIWSNNELVFDGFDTLLQIDNSDEINLQTLTEKNITISFSTSSDTSSRQVIYEEGGGTRGMNIYIDNDKLYCGFWNDKNDGDGAQSFISLSKNIDPNADYVVTWSFDYSNYTTPSGEDGKLDCFLNTQFIGSANTTTRIFKHGGAIGLGAQNSGTYFHDGKDNAGQANFFNGTIRDVIINNKALRQDVIQGLHNYLSNF